jgi:hypothetical protein
VYVQDEEKNDLVNASFEDLYPEHVGAKSTIQWWGKIARDLLAKESEDVKEAFKKRAKEEFREAIEIYKSKQEGSSVEGLSIREGSMVEVHLRMIATVQPLLDALRAQTGYHITLLAGTVEDGKFDVRL